MRKVFKEHLSIIIVLLFCIPAIWNLMQPGFFPMHDDTQPTRIFQMAKALGDGHFPVRYAADLGYGYGYPIFNFYGPLPYYMGGLLVLFGTELIIATKITFILGIVFSGISMFFLGRRFWGTWGGIMASILYVYAPYHAVQSYVRGSLGELWAYAFIPLVFLGLFSKSISLRRDSLVSGIALSAIILSHNITALIVFFMLFGWCGVLVIRDLIKKKLSKMLLYLILLITIGLTLSAFFWLPALTEAKLTRSHTLVEGTNAYDQHFVYLDQLWDSPWGFAGSASGRADGMSFKIGKLHLVIALLGITLWFGYLRKIDISRIIILLIFLFGVSVLMTNSLSTFLWQSIPFLIFAQYPWRFLVFVSFFVSLLGGSICGLSGVLKKKNLKFIDFGFTILITIFIVAFYTKYFQPQFITQKTAADYSEKSAVIWDISKISDEYLPYDFPIPSNPSEAAKEKFASKNDIIIENSEYKTHFLKLTAFFSKEKPVGFAIANFPNWRFFVDNIEVHSQVFGRSQYIVVPFGRHNITAYLQDTWVRRFGNAVSMFGLVFVLIWAVSFDKLNFHEKE